MIDLRVGDTRQLIRDIPDGSISLVATSPPFLALRSYLPADHDDKHAEIGSEPSPAAFLDTLLELTAEWGRVLAPWGSLAIELGDTYSGSGGGGGDYLPGGLREGEQQFAGSAAAARESNAAHWRAKNQTAGAWPAAKSLALIPQLYSIALAYGINPITGQPSPAGKWLARNVITWHRNNPPVGALGDKFRPSTSYITVATRDKARWFDLSAVRNAESDTATRLKNGYAMVSGNPAHDRPPHKMNAAGAPPLDCWFDGHDTWSVNTRPSRLAHYAMWPPKLAERLVLSMCPEWVCATCGQPRRRIEDCEPGITGTNHYHPARNGGQSTANTLRSVHKSTTLGWSDCGHDNYTAGTVLDPFAGTFTTGAVADLHRRDAIGFELNAHSASLYPQRRAEVARNLFGTIPELPGQQNLFDGAA